MSGSRLEGYESNQRHSDSHLDGEAAFVDFYPNQYQRAFRLAWLLSNGEPNCENESPVFDAAIATTLTVVHSDERSVVLGPSSLIAIVGLVGMLTG